MTRYVRYLSLVPLACLIRHILSPLECIRGSQSPIHLSRFNHCTEQYVQPLYLHFSKVEHCPTELVGGWQRYNFILNNVVVAVQLSLQATQPSLLKGFTVNDSYIILSCFLRFKTLVSYGCVVQIIEGWHTEDLLVEASKLQIYTI